MPRGVYDRSKSKAQRATEKVAAPVSAPKKQTKKIGKQTFAEGVAPQSAGSLNQSIGTARGFELRGYFQDLINLRGGIASQGNGSTNFPNSYSLGTMVDGELTRVIQALSAQHFPVSEARQEAAPAISNGVAPAPVAVAPAPFNAPTFAPAPTQA